MKTRYIWIMAMAVVALTGCQKERVNGNLELIAEGMNGNTKLAINGLQSYWVDGESVRINDDDYTISVNAEENGKAYVNSGDEVGSSCCGVYPATIYSSNAGTDYVLDLPTSYTYATTTFDGNTVQNLASPMVAYATGSATRLYFKHVTAAVGVQVVNYYGFTIEVDRIVVSSDNYKLNGSVAINMTTVGNNNFAVEAKNNPTDAEKKVEMVFDGSDNLQIFAGDSAVVQVPVLPVGADNHFTVKVYVHKVDQAAVTKTMEKTQNTGGELARAKMGYARFTTPGLFSVSDSKKVIISQGNLQYQASTGTWQFSKTQYGYIGNEAGNTTTVADRENQEYWIDLFGWGTSGWNNGNTYYQPYCAKVTGWSNNDYGPKSGETFYNLSGDYANSDWGVYNRIYNGGNEEGRWHTPTQTEWSYLINYSRAASNVVNGMSRAKYTYADVNGIHGVIFFPDEFTVPAFIGSSTWGTINSSSAWTTTIELEDWYLLEAAGCIFLPASGSRGALGPTGTTPSLTNVNSYGHYWSSVQNSNSNAYYMRFYSSNGFSSQNASKYQGYSVRLVRNVQ